MSTHPTPEKIMQIGMGFWASKTLLSAIELGIFTELAKRPEDLKTIASRLGLHSRAAADFMDALVAIGFLTRDGGVYANTPETNLFLDKHKPSYIGGILEMANHRLFNFWYHLTEALKTGQPQNEAKDNIDLFGVLYADPARLREFLGAMTGVSRGAAMAIGQKFPWQNHKKFMDVGTAQGDMAVQVALQHPHLSGIGFDLPQVGPIFEDYVAENQLSGRLAFVGGDFFNEELPKTDVIIMGHILHDWDLAKKRMLIEKAYRALPDGGAFIAFDAIIDDERRANAFGLLMSLNMLIETSGGFDYTGADCVGWMKEAGFKDVRVEHLVGPDSMVIGIK